MQSLMVVNQADWTIIQDVFHGAMNLAPAERAAYVRARGLDAALELEILAMVSVSTGALDRIPTDLPIDEGPRLKPGDTIGAYRLLSPLQEGGMGVVFLAERADDQYQQKVAVKFIRGELALFGLERRFRTERQILANLNHPNIAKLIDGGVTPAGQAYLVMEFVEGRTLTEACKTDSLTEKLRLFVKVCDAVQYAHRNLVVHRDLKPGNILVNADHEPKLLDFGIAKMLDSSDAAEQTATAARTFTPRYASPEQVLGKPVSTLSDVYSLGVVLFEMLTGVLPYDAKSLESTRLFQAIVEDEPNRPSSAASGLPSDLDFIVLKALSKEPALRYGSVADLAGDIQNFLDGRPVAARAPTLRYRARKFVRRHRGGVAAAVIALAAITAGIGLTLWQAHVANLERDKARAVSQFLQDLIQNGGPYREKFQSAGVDLKVVDVLDDSAQMIDRQFANQPGIAIEMHHTLALSYLGLGAWDKARPQAESALALARRQFGESNVTTAGMYLTLGEVQFKQDNNQAALPNLRRAYEIYTAVAPADPRRITILKTLSQAQLNLGLRDEGLRDSQAAVDAFRKLGPGRDSDLGLALCDLATAYRQLGNSEQEDKAGKESIDILRRVPAPPYDFATCLHNRALYLQDQNRQDEALAAITEAISFTRKKVGEGHVELAAMLAVKGDIHRFLHHETEARAAMEDALRIALQLYPRDEEWPQYILYQYAKLECDPFFQQYEAGVKKLQEALTKRRPHLTPDDLQLSGMTFSLGRCLLPLHRDREAEPLLAEAIRIRVKRFGKDSATTKRAVDLYRQVLGARGVKVDAEQAIALAAK